MNNVIFLSEFIHKKQVIDGLEAKQERLKKRLENLNNMHFLECSRSIRSSINLLNFIKNHVKFNLEK